MTETDATKRPLQMPENFLPYLEKYRIYKLFKDMLQDLIINLPKDHLKHMKVYLSRFIHCSKDPDRIMILKSPELTIDLKRVVKDLLKDICSFVITRRCVMDRYERHDDYVPGCVSPVLMSEVTKMLTMKDPVPQSGWLMFDHPCTVREARCLLQDGVLPTVTLVLSPPPPAAPRAHDPRTRARSFFDQDFEGLKFAYKSTLKWGLMADASVERYIKGSDEEVYIDADEASEPEKIAMKCFNAISACAAGAQGAGQGAHASGAPGVYRVLLLGAKGSGRRTQANTLAQHFGLVCLHFDDLCNEAKARNDDVGEKFRKFGPSIQLHAEIVRRRLAQKDCIDNGWVLTGYPSSGIDFERLDTMPTPPNRIIFLNVDWKTCKARVSSRGMDWCTGREAPVGSGPRVLPHPANNERLDAELDYYYTETLAELRAAAGITAIEIDGTKPIDIVQVKVQAAVMASPAFNIEYCAQLRNVRGD